MLRLLASSAALALVATVAAAADLPMPVEPMPAAAPMAGYDWTGFYVGAFGGFGWGEVDADFIIPPGGAVIGNATYDVDGFIAGGQIGADWQWNWVVLGVRGDAAWTDISGDDGGEDGAIDAFDANVIASLTGRVGIGFDRFHPYALGGGAIMNYDYTLEDPGTGASETQDQTDFGVTVGGGLEVGITNNISIFGEYRHYWFDGDDITFAGPGAVVAQDINADVQLDTVYAGLNWRF